MVKPPVPAWTYREVLNHIRLHHPCCPGVHAHQIILRILTRPQWQGVRLGEAVGVEMQNYIRHQLTNYDNLLKCQGVERAEARAQIKSKVRKILAKWDRPKPKKMQAGLAPPADEVSDTDRALDEMVSGGETSDRGEMG